MLRILFFLLTATVVAQPDTLPTAVSERLTQLLEADIPHGAPGGVVGVVRDGEVVYSGYAGRADLKEDRLIGPLTRFNIASNAKQFTALCILRLADQGKLSLEDDIRHYIPQLPAGETHTLRVRHLLSHTSGIRDVYNLWSLQGLTWWQRPLGNDDALRLLRQQTELNFPPGSQYLYSNSNYLLLTEIVARVSGSSFAEYAARLFDDLGMEDTRFVTDHTRPIPHLARPYFNFDTWQTYELLSDVHGDGGLFTTLPDMLRYEYLLQDPTGLPDDLSRILMSSQQLPPEQVGTYGYGVEHGTYRGQRLLFHNGSTGAWKASFLRFPELNLAVVVANNSGKFFASDLAGEVADELLEDPPAGLRYPVVPPADVTAPVADVVGIYGVTQGYVINIAPSAGATLSMERFGRAPVDLVPVRPGVYREAKDTTFYQMFSLDPAGEKQITLFHPSHAPYSLRAFGPATADPRARTPSLVGVWVSEETGAEVTIDATPSGPRIVLHGDTLETEQYAPPVLLTPGYVWLQAVRDGRPGLFLFDDRLRWVRFRRE